MVTRQNEKKVQAGSVRFKDMIDLYAPIELQMDPTRMKNNTDLYACERINLIQILLLRSTIEKFSRENFKQEILNLNFKFNI